MEKDLRKHIVLVLLLAALALPISGCAVRAERALPTAPAVTATPAITPEPTARPVSEKAEAFIRPVIDEALAALEKVRRDDLSKVTTPFDMACAYSDGPEPPEEERVFFDDVCALIVESLPQDASAYDKYRYLGYVISLCCEYDYEDRDDSVTPYGALIGGRGICLGYTNAMLYLCQLADLWCAGVHGYASWNGEEHGWDLVALEDGTYYVDVTWCDQLGEVGNTTWNRYFMVTEAKLTEDHGVWEGGPATGETIYN